MGCICFFPNSCGELWRSAATGTKVSIACPQSSECIQQEQVTQLQLHLHFIRAKRVNCLHHFLAQYFTLFQLILLQRLEICYSQRLKKVPTQFELAKKHSVRSNENLKSQDKVRELETKIIGQCYFYFKD